MSEEIQQEEAEITEEASTSPFEKGGLRGIYLKNLP
jgi:hypothetical protein